MDPKTYDPKSVTAIVGDVYLTGFSESMIEIEKEEDSYEVKQGAQGDVALATINSALGTIKFTLLQTSPQVPYLDRLASSRKLVPVTVIAAGDPKETSSATQAYVKKPASRSYGKSIEDREYELQCLDLKME